MSKKKLNSINQIIKSLFINESTNTATSSGSFNAPLEIENKKWDDHVLSPFIENSEHYHNEKIREKELNDKIKFKHGHIEKDNPNKGKSEHMISPITENELKEDLAVWFGTKKKPKGSKQPKGPWVNICRKKDGKHPPCGRPDTSKGGYPKCRAAGVAAKMTDAQKKAACSQKRRAEKKDTQKGKGQKPVMTSYKPRKKKSQNESYLINLIIKKLK